MALKAFADGSLYGERYGDGPARVLALHGWGRDRKDFAQVLDGLDALSLDLPGFGASPSPAQPMGGAGYGQAVATLRHEFSSPPVVVGHSFGGRVAVCLAAAYPETVSALVLTGAPLLPRRSAPSSMSISFRLARMAHKLGLLSDKKMESRRRRHGSVDYRSATGVMRKILVKVVNESYEKELAKLSCPVRLVWGANDKQVPVSMAEQIATLLEDVSLHVVEGVGHNLPLAAPRPLRRAIEEFL